MGVVQSKVRVASVIVARGYWPKAGKEAVRVGLRVTSVLFSSGEQTCVSCLGSRTDENEMAFCRVLFSFCVGCKSWVQ